MQNNKIKMKKVYMRKVGRNFGLYKACHECLVRSACTKDIQQGTACDLQMKQQLEVHLKHYNSPYEPITNKKEVDIIFKAIQEVNKGNFAYILEFNNKMITCYDLIHNLELQYFLKIKFPDLSW